MRIARPPPQFSSAQEATDEHKFRSCDSQQSERKSGAKRPLIDFAMDDDYAYKRLSSEKALICVMDHEVVSPALEAFRRHANPEKGASILGRHESVKSRPTQNEVDLNASGAATAVCPPAHSNGNKTAKQVWSMREQEIGTMSGRNVLRTGVHGRHFSEFGLHSDQYLIKEDTFECMEVFNVNSNGGDRGIAALSKPKDAKCEHDCSIPHRGCYSAACAGDRQDAPRSSYRTAVEKEAKGLRSECQPGRCAASAASPRVLVDVTNKFQIDVVPAIKRNTEEDDIHRLSQRYKQIEFGKNTLGYEHYIEVVPKWKRKSKDPKTPNPKQVCSKRSWDGQIRKWRRLLHNYDPPLQEGEELAEDLTNLKSAEKQEKPEDDQDGDVVDNVPCNRSDGLQESKYVVMAVKKLEMSIYEDWMET